MTIAIGAIVVTMASPSLRTFIQNNRIATQTNELIAALSLARNEAVTRGEAASVCASDDGATCSLDDDWAGGWLVFVDRTAPVGDLDLSPGADVLLRVYPALKGGGTLTASAPAVTYRSDGFLSAAAAADFRLRIPYCTGSQARDITVTLPGRAAVAHVDC